MHPGEDELLHIKHIKRSVPDTVQSVLRVQFTLVGTLRELATLTGPASSPVPRHLPCRSPYSSQAPDLALPLSSPQLLSPTALLSPQGPKSRPDSAAHWLSRAKGWCPDNGTLQPYLCPSPRPWPWWACPCPSALCLGFLASFWQSQHPFLPAPLSLAPRELPRPGRRAEP